MSMARGCWALGLCCAAALACEDDECRSQCGPSEECDEQPFESFGDLEAGRATYEERCEMGADWAFEGLCADGTIVLRWGGGFTSEARFFDPDSGDFLGLTATTDVSISPCYGKSYWPVPVSCRSPVVTRVLCGTSFAVGDSAGRGATQ